MEVKAIFFAIIAAVTGMLGLFGWSHKSLRQRMTEMEIELHKKPNYSDARTIMADKIAPLQVEYHSLTRRLDDLQRENHKINDKMDKLLIICTELAHAKK